MEPTEIIESLKRLRVPHERIAGAIGRDRTAATKLLGGVRNIQATEIAPLSALVAEYEPHIGNTPDLPHVDSAMDYVTVEVLPTFAGMGGGGTGDADRQTALLPRSLVLQELRAQPNDLLLINVRGDSMEPVFQHGDQLVIDCRDKNPLQPGPFALWFDDGYVVKNVERIRQTGRYRIFSSNPAYSPDEADPDDVTIMGRPVWYARRL